MSYHKCITWTDEAHTISFAMSQIAHVLVGLLIRRSRVRTPLGPPNEDNELGANPNTQWRAVERPFALPFAPPSPDGAVLQAAIHRLTAALATAADDVIADLVAERRVLREELRVLQEGSADIVCLDDERARQRQ